VQNQNASQNQGAPLKPSAPWHKTIEEWRHYCHPYTSLFDHFGAVQFGLSGGSLCLFNRGCGFPNAALPGNAAFPSTPIGTLVGRIGADDGFTFAVGRWKVFTAPNNGTLRLAMNDTDYGDNAGFVTVQIMIEHPK
jgi:hypothetical protein